MEGKWIPGLTPEMKIAKAGKIILSTRCEAVRHWLPLVAHAEKDMEFVHQLRVSTRRAGAGLVLFEDRFKEKDFRFAKKLLRSIRQAAGEARDWDVFQESLFQNPLLEDPEGQSIRLFLFGLATSRRMSAQTNLVETARTLRQELDWLCDHVESFVHELEPERNLVFADLAFSKLQELMNHLRQSAHPIPERYEALHQIRILGKRLRYAMELFVSCFSPPFKETLYPLIEEMQEILGEANDSHVIALRLQEIRQFVKAYRPNEWPLIQPGLERLQNDHHDRLPKQRQLFIDWLPRWDQAIQEIPLKTITSPVASVM